jgi:hypothetical protein
MTIRKPDQVGMSQMKILPFRAIEMSPRRLEDKWRGLFECGRIRPSLRTRRSGLLVRGSFRLELALDRRLSRSSPHA